MAGNFDGDPAELRQSGDQAADQRGLAHAPAAAAHNDDGHQRIPVSLGTNNAKDNKSSQTDSKSTEN
jgi:hypothetical protein